MYVLKIRRLPSAILVLALACGTGCGGKDAPAVASAPRKPQKLPIAARGKSILTGKISHQGKPIVAGRLCFFSENGLVPTAGVISSLGTYKVEGLSPGEHWICVLLDPSGRLPFAEAADVPPPKNGAANSAVRIASRKPSPPPGVAAKKTKPNDESSPWADVPPPTLMSFRNYSVPKPLQSTYSLLHGKYGRLGPSNPLKCNLSEGDNAFDITLP